MDIKMIPATNRLTEGTSSWLIWVLVTLTYEKYTFFFFYAKDEKIAQDAKSL